MAFSLVMRAERLIVNEKDYAGLLAQVIPVVLLAVVAELAGLHRVYREVMAASEAPLRPGKGSGRPARAQPQSPARPPHPAARMLPYVLVTQYAVVGLLIVLEMAALAVAGVSHPSQVARALVDPSFVVTGTASPDQSHGTVARADAHRRRRGSGCAGGGSGCGAPTG